MTSYNWELCYSHPGYFGKVGMRYIHLTRNKYYCPVINVDKLWSLVSENTRTSHKTKTDKAPVIDVVRAVSILWCVCGVVCLGTVLFGHTYLASFDYCFYTLAGYDCYKWIHDSNGSGRIPVHVVTVHELGYHTPTLHAALRQDILTVLFG